MSPNTKPSIRPPSTAAARPSRSSIRPPSTAGAGPSGPMPSTAGAGPSRSSIRPPSTAGAGPSRPPSSMPSTAGAGPSRSSIPPATNSVAGPSRPPDPVDEVQGLIHLILYADDLMSLPGFYPALEIVDTHGNDVAIVIDDAKAEKGIHVDDAGQGVRINGSNGGLKIATNQGVLEKGVTSNCSIGDPKHTTNHLSLDKGKGLSADAAKAKQGTLDRMKGASVDDDKSVREVTNQTLLDKGKQVVDCCAKGKEFPSVAPKSSKWADVLNIPADNTVLTRRYPLGENTDAYFRFLHGMKHRNVVQVRYQVNKVNESIIVFKHKYDMTLRRYLEITRPHLLCTGTNKDDRIQRDFQDLTISILRQTALGVQYYQETKGIDCGYLSLDFVFLKLVPNKPPHVFVMLENYERTACRGAAVNLKNATDGARRRTWQSYGMNILEKICAELYIEPDEAYEIFSLINRCKSKMIRSFEDFDTDPALILEQKKLDLVSDSFQGIIMQKREDFFTTPPTHPCPKELLQEPWTQRFCYVLRNLKKDVRITYEADDANNYFHLWRFLRNVIEHILSNEGLQNNYGNGATFIRFVRAYYPALYRDLIHMITVKYTSRTAKAIVRKLKEF